MSNRKTPKTIFVSGIDTDAGKSYATAWLASRMMARGLRVVTQKFIQTGNTGESEDILLHRKLTGTGPLPEDKEGLTAPLILSYPASAQLAARIDGVEIDFNVIDKARIELEKRYDRVLLEGAGGLMVPVTNDIFTIDYVASRHLPLVLVTNSRLGSINHTVLSLEAIRTRGIELLGVVYNHHFDTAPEIAADSRRFVEQYLRTHFPGSEIWDMPSMDKSATQKPDITISKEVVAAMPAVRFGGSIHVVDSGEAFERAMQYLERQTVVGFDTETRPSFRKGQLNNVALVQLSTDDHAFLFRSCVIGIPPRLRKFLEDSAVSKVGLSVKDDFTALRRVVPSFNPAGFIELQQLAHKRGIAENSLQKIYAILFGERISKGQRLTNWEASELTAPQCQYAAIDAWASLQCYNRLESSEPVYL